jgi:hypothetical protein
VLVTLAKPSFSCQTLQQCKLQILREDAHQLFQIQQMQQVQTYNSDKNTLSNLSINILKFKLFPYLNDKDFLNLTGSCKRFFSSQIVDSECEKRKVKILSCLYEEDSPVVLVHSGEETYINEISLLKIKYSKWRGGNLSKRTQLLHCVHANVSFVLRYDDKEIPYHRSVRLIDARDRDSTHSVCRPKYRHEPKDIQKKTAPKFSKFTLSDYIMIFGVGYRF